MKDYANILESLADIVLNINQKDIDRALNQSLALKIRFLIANIADFRDVYIGNHYCPEVIAFLLKEFMFTRFGKVYNAPLKVRPEEEDDEPVRMEGQGKKQAHIFGKTISTLKAYCLELEED